MDIFSFLFLIFHCLLIGKDRSILSFVILSVLFWVFLPPFGGGIGEICVRKKSLKKLLPHWLHIEPGFVAYCSVSCNEMKNLLLLSAAVARDKLVKACQS